MAAIDNDIYNHIPATWWDEDGFMAILRESVNPPRFAYFRHILRQQPASPQGLNLLDVGCGGGLLAEEFARLGCMVTGIDPSGPSLAAARAHALRTGLRIDYQTGSGEAIPAPDQRFDLVSCCDVLEHVDDPDRVIAEIARVLKPGGIFFFDTINRTLKSWLLAIKLVQDWPLTRIMPRHVHVHEKFIRPAELAAGMARHGLVSRDMTGLAPAPNPLPLLAPFLRLKLGRGSHAELGRALKLRESQDLTISYMGYAIRQT